jgi:peptide deformylase
MSILKVARMGHPVLRATARPVKKSEFADARFQQFIDDMIETMHEYSGVGLAAPQVHGDVRVFVALLGEGEDAEATAVVNPAITPIGETTVEGWEGCLSIPDIRGRVPRWQRIQVQALDRHGRAMTLEACDFPARVIQHEADHLDGVLFFDRMKEFRSLTFLDEFSRYHASDRDDD